MVTHKCRRDKKQYQKRQSVSKYKLSGFSPHIILFYQPVTIKNIQIIKASHAKKHKKEQLGMSMRTRGIISALYDIFDNLNFYVFEK
jgi:hypothetical protein